MNPVLLIPARMASTRLPDKPLADIGGMPMIVRVWARAVAADLGPVVVAAGESAIVAAVEKAGGKALLTDPALPSGSDRIWAALQAFDPQGRHDVVVNLQGDLPALDPEQLKKIVVAWQVGRRHRHPGGAYRQGGGQNQSSRGESGGGLGRARAAGPGAVFHPRHRAHR